MKGIGIALVAAQTTLCLVLLWLGWRDVLGNPWLWLGVAAGAGVSASAVRTMRLARLRLVPEPGADATLCQRGVYRSIRHPMYAGLLLAFAMFAAGAGLWGSWLAWAGLAAVLAIKLTLEERLWLARDPAYRGYMARTKRLVPGIW